MFDFISDDKFREGLESDFREILAAIESKSWKSVHVLAGSIIEAVLADYLLATDYEAKARSMNPKGRDTELKPLEMGFGALIEACKKEGILGEETAQLSRVIQGYRNLIHPGRGLRLGQEITEQRATVAKALVEMIVGEVETKSQTAFGATAVQIVKKLYQDPDSVAFLDHLVRDMNPRELERLLVQELPDTYLNNLVFARTSQEALDGVNALKAGYHVALKYATEPTHRKLAKRFVSILKEASEGRVTAYEDAFFRATEMQYIPAGDLQLVKDQLLSRLRSRGMNTPVGALTAITIMQGIGDHLYTEGEAWDMLAALLVLCCTHFSVIHPYDMQAVFLGEVVQLPAEVRSVIEDRMSSWLLKRREASSSPDEQSWLTDVLSLLFP